MEQWEIDLRIKLEKELPEGAYEVSGANLVLWTGKQGKINDEVAFYKAYKNEDLLFTSKKSIGRLPRKKKKFLKKQCNYDLKDLSNIIADYFVTQQRIFDGLKMPISILTEGSHPETKNIYEWKLTEYDKK